MSTSTGRKSPNPYAEHVKTGRAHLRRLATMSRHLLEMSECWGDLDTCLMTELEHQAERIDALSGEIKELMADWRRGAEWED